jgi:hypothetical protein
MNDGGYDAGTVLADLSGEAVWRQLLFSAAPNNEGCPPAAPDCLPLTAASSEAIANLIRWPEYLDTDYETDGPAPLLLPDDYFNNALCASIQGIRAGRRKGRVQARLSECTRLLFPALLEEGQKEGRRGLMLHLMRLQQLVEVQEVVVCVDRRPRPGQGRLPLLLPPLPHAYEYQHAPRLAQVLAGWRERLGGGSALNDSVCCENLLSLRLALLTSSARTTAASLTPHQETGEASSLPLSGTSSAAHLFMFLWQVLDVAGGEGGGERQLLVSPLLYQVKSLLFGADSSCENSGQDLAKAEFALFERYEFFFKYKSECV